MAAPRASSGVNQIRPGSCAPTRGWTVPPRRDAQAEVGEAMLDLDPGRASQSPPAHSARRTPRSDAAASISGKHHNPPQMPGAGRPPASPRPAASTSIAVERSGTAPGRAGLGQLRRSILAPGHARLAHRALAAARRASHADAGAEIHQSLGVGLDLPLGQQRARARPQRLSRRRLSARVACDAELARQHALDVAVQDGVRVHRRRKRRWRRRCDAPIPGKRGTCRVLTRKRAAVIAA